MRRLGLVLPLAIFTLALLASAQWARPDLVVKEVRLNPAEPGPDDLVKITAVIANEGPGDARGSFDVRFKVDGLPIGRQRVARLKAGGTVAVEARWPAVEGEHRVSVEADEPFDRIQELDERNNAREISVTVRRKAAIYSVTEQIMLTAGKTLQTMGEMFHFTIEDEVYTALDEGIEKLERAQLALETAGWELAQLRGNLPRPLSEDPAITSGQAIGEVFGKMAASLDAAASALRSFDVDVAATAIEEIKAELNELARLSFDGVELGRLTEAAGYIAEAAQAALTLQASLFGSDSSSSSDGGGEGTIDGLVAELQVTLGKAGDVLGSVGAQIEAHAANRGIIFTAEGGGSLAAYHRGETLLIQVYGAFFLMLEVYDSEGSLVAGRVVIDERLRWQGRGNLGSLLPAGEYFYKLKADRGAGEETDIGRILIS